MKRIFTIMAVLTGICLMQAKENQVFYYDGHGGKIYLDKIENTKTIHFKKAIC